VRQLVIKVLNVLLKLIILYMRRKKPFFLFLIKRYARKGITPLIANFGCMFSFIPQRKNRSPLG